MKTRFRILASVAAMATMLFASCATQPATEVGTRAEALDASAWEASTWISAVDAPVVTERKGDRAADGASWFVSTVKNEQAVTSAKWMTTSLGVYEIYVNGQSVGTEFLKPGFTDVRKTRRSFTYDITDAFKTSANAGEGFPYHLFINAENEAEFDEHIKTCKDLAFYDTGVSASYGDKLITLSTCEYTLSNGRFVVVAVRVS